MSEELGLIDPTVELETEYLAMLEDWRHSGEKPVPFVLKMDPGDFAALVQKLQNFSKGIGVAERYVPHSTFWLVNRERKILGVVNIRHYLNDELLIRGGHIGYGVRPSERRKGYATLMLKLALEKATNLGLERVLLTCDRANIASVNTILRNGGALASEALVDGTMIQRYWIETR